MSDKLRVIQVGCGRMAQTWCRLASAHPRIELVGLVDLQREAAEQTAQRHGLDASVVYESLASAVNGAEPDAVFDVTVPAAHHDVTMEALSRGCHVLGEKPMAETLEQAGRMVSRAREKGAVYAVAQTRRPNPQAVRVQRAVRAGLIGEVEEVHADFYIGARFGGSDPASNFRNAMDHPLILDMAIHTFDQARQLADLDPTTAYCRSWNPGHSWYRGDASAMAIFDATNAGGRPAVFSYRGSWCAEGRNTDWNAAWRIIGSEGTITWDGAEDVRVERLDHDRLDDEKDALFRPLISPQPEAVTLEHAGHEGIIDNFVAHLLDGEALWCPCDDNIKSFAMVCAAVASLEGGGRVEVAW